ncbi:retinoschisin-like [Montipora capricornis]|uniref:retinoschisin-like n=1 Tax=Montipora capricornis TaxID=246305 RepID=UPI0035F10800
MTNGKYSCDCAVGWKGDQCEKCHTALGMESGEIKDDQITASTSEAEHQASRGRLNYKVPSGKVGSWSARVKDNMQWFQVDFGSGNRNVSGIATQGGTNYREKPKWVEKYQLMFSDDGVNFQYYNGGGATEKVFIANKNRDTVVYNELSQPITSRYIRIRPLLVGKRSSWFAMRVEFYGCQEIKPCDSSPCLNGGNCTNEADGNFTCHCASGWTGETCQQKGVKGIEKSVIIGDNPEYLAKLASDSTWLVCADFPRQL